MAEPFLSEVRLFSFGFPPQGWATCDGQFLPINQNQGLFSLLGTTFGGNGQTNFALPDLRGRVPIKEGSGHTLGEKAGQQSHTLSISELPQHTHTLHGSSSATNTNIPAAGTTVWGDTAPNQAYRNSQQNMVAMNAAFISNVGGNQPHENRQPFLVLNFCIALQGIFPSQT